MSEQDLAISLPTDTSTFSAVGMLPVGRLDDCHALILADDVAPEEVEALAMSQDAQAGWVGASRLQLSPGVELQGPWPVDADLRRLMNLPEWASQIMILECEPQRGGPLPPELTGIDPMADAFPQAQPEGAELLALVRLRAIARRLAGALLLRGDPAHPNGATRVSRRRRSILVQPDPSSSVNLDVYAPVWLTPDATQTLLSRVLPGATQRLEPMAGSGAAGLSEMDQAQLERLTELIGADALDRAWRQAEERRRKREAEIARAAAAGEVFEEIRDGYAITGPVDASRRDWGFVEVRVGGAELLPLAVKGAKWAGDGAAVYSAIWQPVNAADRDPKRMTPDRRQERERATGLIERIAVLLAQASGGVPVDEDGFLVAL